MATTDAGIRGLLADSGQPRTRVSPRTDLVTALLGAWLGIGLMVDAWAHSNLELIETFFTPWHALFYSGFAAVSAWIIWQVWRNVRTGRQGLAAVPQGYLAGLLAIPAFALFGLADMTWHVTLGIEQDIDILFSPSHLGLVTSMAVIMTTPVRSAWSDPERRPSLARLLPAILGLAFATSIALLFLSYGTVLDFPPRAIVSAFSEMDPGGGPEPRMFLDPGTLASGMVITNLILLAPVLLLLRRWELPFGTVTVLYAVEMLMPGAGAAFENAAMLLTIIVAGLASDLLILRLRPSAGRRAAYWAFATLAPLVTWFLFIGVASALAGGLPTVPELWTGAPLVAALVGLVLGVLFLPNAQRDAEA